MATLSSLNIQITATADQAASILKQLQGQAETSFKGIQDQSEKTKTKMTELNSSIELGKKAFSMLSLVVSGAGGLIKSYADSEVAQTKLEVSMRNVKGASADAVEQLSKQASALQDLTGMDGEQIKMSQAMLGTFQLNEQAVGALTPRILDMAAAMQQSTGEQQNLQQLSVLMGKAVQGNVGALSKYGIVMTDAQKAQMETASGMERVNLLAKIMDDNFKGTAEAIGNSAAGSLQKMQQTLGDVQEDLGGLVLEILKPLLPIIQQLGERLKELLEKSNMKEWAGKLGDAIGKIASGLMPVMDALGPILSGVMDVVNALLPPIADLVKVLLEALKPILDVVIGVLKDLAPIAGSIVAVVARLIVALKPLLEVVAKLVLDILKPFMPLIQSLVDLLASALPPLLSLLIPIITFIVENGVKLIMLVVNPIVDAIRFIIDNAKAAIDAIAKIFGGEEEAAPQQKLKAITAHSQQQASSAPIAPGTGFAGSGATGGGGGGKKKTLKDEVSEFIALNKLLVDDGQSTTEAMLTALKKRLDGIRGHSVMEMEARKALRDEIKSIEEKAAADQKKRADEQKKADDELSKKIKERNAFEHEIRVAEMNERQSAEQAIIDEHDRKLAELNEFYREHLFSDEEFYALKESLTSIREQKLYDIQVEYNKKRLDEDKKAFDESVKIAEGLVANWGSIGDAMAAGIGDGKGIKDSLKAVLNLLADAVDKAIMTGVAMAVVQGVFGNFAAAGIIIAAKLALAAAKAGIASFAVGGFTGAGNNEDVAGVVHRNEFVSNARATARNRDLFEALNAGATINEYYGGKLASPELPQRNGATKTLVQLEGIFKFEGGALVAQIKKDAALESQGVL